MAISPERSRALVVYHIHTPISIYFISTGRIRIALVYNADHF